MYRSQICNGSVTQDDNLKASIFISSRRVLHRNISFGEGGRALVQGWNKVESGMASRADLGAGEAMADQGAQGAMVEQTVQEAMVGQGALGAMAEQTVQEAMAGQTVWEAMAGRPPWP
ncbi:L(+)-tartrate dehydratase subunit beta [Labeo rohita]|uniref:L(+)-tartrate dehydratase subunit beta n=1 Tax=Labeo rohita TaxID=84645 RepID=A0ABQ8L8E0_LABRO|nr:L(+)-tartrate dehydratase subunit beta [Labeo rohita]